jgi:hypothetical protein
VHVFWAVVITAYRQSGAAQAIAVAWTCANLTVQYHWELASAGVVRQEGK